MVAPETSPESNARDVHQSSAEMEQSSTIKGRRGSKRTGSCQSDGFSRDAFFEEFRSLLISCGGVVDVASLFFQDGCRGQGTDEPQHETMQPAILKPTLKNQSQGVKSRRRQGETLEFPSHGGFDDDVSAISAHTLEEMERLQLMASKMPLPTIPSPPRTPRIPPSGNSEHKREIIAKPRIRCSDSEDKLDWNYQLPRQTSNTSASLGVSTSGSGSSSDQEKFNIGKNEEYSTIKIYSRVEV